jgi:hypothetical protein
VTKLFQQDKAALVTVVYLLKTAIVILGDVEDMLADPAGQLLNRTIIAIWDDWGDVHSTLIPFRSIMHVSISKDTTTMSTLRPARPMMASDTACVNNSRKFSKGGLCSMATELDNQRSDFTVENNFPGDLYADDW